MTKEVNTINICKKANKLTFGETLINKIRSKKVALVVILNDASDNSKKKVEDKCKFYDVEYLYFFTKNELIGVFHKPISSFGILDYNLALKFKSNIKGG